MNLDEEPTLSRDIFENEIRLEFVRQSYRPVSLGVAFGLAVLVTALPGLLGLISPPVLDGSFARGFEMGLDAPASVLVWSLCLAQLPAMLLSRYFLSRGESSGAFYRAYWVQSVLQFLWLQTLIFYMVPLFPLIGVALMFGLFFSWVFNDCLALYDSPLVKLQYLLAFPLFDLMLLGVDALGGRGLLYALEHNPQYFANILILQLALILLTQSIISVVGRHIYDHDYRQVIQSWTLQKVASVDTERKVLEATWGIMANGLEASKFAHDLGNQVMILQGAVGGLKKELGEPGTERTSKVLAPNWKLLGEVQEDLEWAARTIAERVREFAVSVQTEGDCAMADVHELMERAVRQTHEALYRSASDGAPPEIRCELEPAEVYVTQSHGSLLANLMTNGIQQRPGQPLDISGVRVNQWFYLIRIRDYGVSEQERPAAIRNVLKAITIDQDRRVDRSRQYRGYGMALLLAKILLVRHNGWLGVSKPAQGPGLEMNVILPMWPKVQIPKAQNHPELAVKLLGLEILTLTDILQLSPEHPRA